MLPQFIQRAVPVIQRVFDRILPEEELIGERCDAVFKLLRQRGDREPAHVRNDGARDFPRHIFVQIPA